MLTMRTYPPPQHTHICNYVFIEPWNIGQGLHLRVSISSPSKDVIVLQMFFLYSRQPQHYENLRTKIMENTFNVWKNAIHLPKLHFLVLKTFSYITSDIVLSI